MRQVAATIRRYNMLATGESIGVAVSGGADSVCLLHLLLELAQSWDLKLSVLHVDHRLRGEESARDAAFVRNLAAALGLPFHLFEIDAAAVPGNLEQAGRNARYAFFRERIASGAVNCVALGHTRSDQAETVLFRFLRGAGTAGLAGIRPVTPEGFIRPLIDISRGEVEAWLREHDIAWREDSTNADCGFRRNRIRHVLLPALARDWNPALTGTLAHLADWALAEEDYWNSELDRIAGGVLLHRPPAVFLNAIALDKLPVAANRRLVRRAIETAKGDLRSIDFGHVERVRAAVGAGTGHDHVQVPGLDVVRSFDWIRMAPRVRTEDHGFTYPLLVPGRIKLHERDSVLELELKEYKSIYNESVDCLDWDRLSGSLELRSWRVGDRYRRLGHSGEERLKHLFQQARVPIWERRLWPVITRENQIVWARTFGPRAEFAVGPESRKVLLIREIGESGIGKGSLGV